MNLLLDTNILLYISRANDVRGILRFINPDNSPFYLSVISVCSAGQVRLCTRDLELYKDVY